MEKVIAVVVSYNRQALLAECVKALQQQTRKPDAILVINNGSTDNTAVWLDGRKDLHHITQSNVGGAGGFSRGIKWAYQNGYSWIWCMDDDGYPKEDALEMLLKNEGHERALLNCAVLDKNDKQSFVWKTGNFKTINEVKQPVINGIGHPFNGTLIHRSIIAKVGVPKAKFFVWGDETEFYYRIIKRYNIPVKTITSSVHYHPATNYSYKNDWQFEQGWKMYYYLRNRFDILKSKYPTLLQAIAGYIFFLGAFSLLTLRYQKTSRLKKINFMIWPVMDALRNRFDATPSTVLYKLREQQSKTVLALWMAPIKSWVAHFLTPQVSAEHSTTATA
jgi:rhamnopyranosyl-N-acetylglucosaminyl-diphospho-decaprenol beta-1,3/1,4-galactofuranosyltransferase